MVRRTTRARRVLAAAPGLVPTVVLALVGATLGLVGATLVAAPAQAAGTPDLGLTGGPATSVLYGKTVPVDLTASLPAGAPKGYNLAYRVVLPAGTSYVAGSAGDDGEPQILTNAPSSGETTLIWPNVDDLVASSSHTLSFQVDYNDTSATGTPKYDVGDTLAIDSGAYISTDPRDETDFDSAGQAQPGADSYTGYDTLSTTTSLTAIQIRKSEPHPEGEIPRGVHDHQTVYTLTITNNDVNPTNGVQVDDYLPAGLEFLGCAGTTDHTTDAPTNPGSTDEYAGSGPIVVSHPTVAEECVVPDLVETVDTDPDGSGPLASGVYTHVRWNNVGDFGASQVRTLTYAAAIPIRENTMTWSGATPGTTGAQAANLDNNSGPETYDEQPLLNGATAQGTYQSPVKTPFTVSDEGTLLRTAEDIAIQKSNNLPTLDQGDLTKWTVDVQVSEYRYVTDLVIHDVTPNGLCPLGDTNLAHDPDAQDAECDPVAGKGPSAPYTTVEEQGNGTFDITWDKSTFPSLAKIQPSGTRQLTFWTRTRANYQSAFENSTPVLSRDSVKNDIDTHGEDWIRCAPNDPDCTGSGTTIDADETDGTTDYDVSGSGKAASGPAIEKTVADTYPASGDCSDLPAASYGKNVPLYGPGDYVCWKLRLDFPDNLDTTSQDVFDILPSGVEYVPGTWAVTSNNDVPVGAIDTSVAGRLSWQIGGSGTDVDSGGRTFEVTLKTEVGPPDGHHSGDVEGNLQKFSYENTPGTAFTLRDRTDFQLKMPQLALVKGVKQVDGGTTYGPNTDHKEVQGGSLVTYRVDVTNNGLADATDARVWDVLPTGISCADLVGGSISDGGTCNAGSGRLEWSGIDIAVGATTTLTYQVTVPADVSPAQSYVNTAGVVEYTYVGNHGQDVSLVPSNSTVKDPSLTPNTVAAQDVSDVYTDAATVAKTRTTSVSETGNAASNQATIGERIDYTVTTTIPKGTTIYGTPTVVDPINSQQQLVSGSLCSPACTLDGGALPDGLTVAESPAGTITATFPTSWSNTTNHDVALVLHFSTTVLDGAANTRGATIANKATLTFTDQDGHRKTASGSTSTTVVEPKITLTKTHTPGGRVSADQLLTFTLKATATSGTNYSPAHDVAVVDTLPVGTDPVDSTGDPVADGGTVPSSGGVWDATARTITWTKAAVAALAKVDPGASVNLVYQVRVEHNPVGGVTYTNTADATTTSLDGSVTGIRTSTSATNPGDYKSHATDAVTVVLPSISKTVTPDPTTIGTAVTWHVAVTVPKLTRFYDATVVDTVPDGLVVDGYGAITCTSGCPGGDPTVSTLPVADGGSGKLVAAWYLGDLAPAAGDRVYDLVLTGHVADTYRNGGAQVLDGATLTNSATIKTNRTDKVTSDPTTVPASYDDTVGPVTAATHVREPHLTIDKSADKGPTVKPGETVTYTVVVTNTGTWPAYDTVVTDQPDSELTNVVQTGGASYLTDGWTAGDPDLRWLVSGPLAPGASVTFTYTAQVKAAGVVQPDAHIDNTASIPDYYGAPTSERDAAPGTTWRDYHGPSDSVTLTVIPYADLELTKVADRTEANGGDVITWTITVTNHGLSPAQNAVVTDSLPGHSVLVSTTPSSPTCAVVTSTLTCSFASIPSGATRTITVKTEVVGLPPANTTTPEHTHELTISKVEQALSIGAGATTTYDLACPDNGYLADGSVEVLHVDQGTGTAADVHVLRASSLSQNAYRFVVENDTTGQAQVKLFGTCLPHDTEVASGHSHGLDVGALTTQDTGVLSAGRHTFVIPVSPGHHAIDPGFEVTAGSVRLVASEPVSGGWSFTVDAEASSRATLSLRELGDDTLSAAPSQHKHALSFQHVVRTVSLPPGESVQRVTCPDGSKGVVGTYDLPAGVYYLGSEPQPINRDFRLLNTNAGNVDVTLDLECVGVRTGPALDEDFTITNAASVVSSTYDPDTSNNADSDSVHATISAGTGNQVVPVASSLAVSPNGARATVTVKCGSGGRVCKGSLELSAKAPSGKRVVIGTSSYRLSAGHRDTVRIKIKQKYQSAVRHHRMRGLRVRAVRH